MKEEGMKNKKSRKIKQLTCIVIGIILLALLFSTQNLWTSANWVVSSNKPPISLLCNITVLQFDARSVLSNTTGLETTMITITTENESLIVFSDHLSHTNIASVGSIKWNNGETIALFEKPISGRRYVITESCMLNFTRFGKHETNLFPIVKDIRLPNWFDDIMVENRTTARIGLGFLLVSGFSLGVVPILVHYSEKLKSKKTENE